MDNVDLISLKEIFLTFLQKYKLSEYDQEQTVYVINLIDYFLTKKVQLNDENTKILQDEIHTTVTHLMDTIFEKSLV